MPVAVKAVELDSHWYIIPNVLYEEFRKDSNNEELIDSGQFDDKWGVYMTGGDLNLVQLYIVVDRSNKKEYSY